MPKKDEKSSPAARRTDAAEELFRIIYVQNCEWFRHIENERLSYTSFYAAIVAGTLAFISQAPPTQEQGIVLYAFLICLSVFGLLITLRFRADLEDFMSRIKDMAANLGLEAHVGAGGQNWTKYIRQRELFPVLYAVTLLIFGYLLYIQVVTPVLGK